MPLISLKIWKISEKFQNFFLFHHQKIKFYNKFISSKMYLISVYVFACIQAAVWWMKIRIEWLFHHLNEWILRNVWIVTIQLISHRNSHCITHTPYVCSSFNFRIMRVFRFKAGKLFDIDYQNYKNYQCKRNDGYNHSYN